MILSLQVFFSKIIFNLLYISLGFRQNLKLKQLIPLSIRMVKHNKIRFKKWNAFLQPYTVLENLHNSNCLCFRILFLITDIMVQFNHTSLTKVWEAMGKITMYKGLIMALTKYTTEEADYLWRIIMVCWVLSRIARSNWTLYAEDIFVERRYQNATSSTCFGAKKWEQHISWL